VIIILNAKLSLAALTISCKIDIMFQINGVQSPSDYVKVAVVTDQQVSFLLELDYQTCIFILFLLGF
jgi:hypothetical protein